MPLSPAAYTSTVYRWLVENAAGRQMLFSADLRNIVRICLPIGTWCRGRARVSAAATNAGGDGFLGVEAAGGGAFGGGVDGAGGREGLDLGGQFGG